MVQDGEGTADARNAALTACTHGDDAAVHADVGDWMREWSEKLRERGWPGNPSALKPTMDELRADGGRRFPGCAKAFPLLVVLKRLMTA